jgi:hypothetical protein
MEIELISKHIEKIIKDEYKTIIAKESSNLFLKKDFENLKKIDLEKEVTFKEAIDKLRALSHGDYRNAYFVDRNTGEKVFLRLEIEVEDEFES